MERIVAVHFRHHEGHIVVHTERAAVVNHNSSVARDGVGELFRHACACAYKSEVHAAECVAFLQCLHRDLTAAEAVACARAGRTAEQPQGVHGEILLVEHL